jgi:hypothetical protein
LIKRLERLTQENGYLKLSQTQATVAVLRIRRSMPTQKSQLSACNRISGGHMYLQSVSKQTLVEIEAEMTTNK